MLGAARTRMHASHGGAHSPENRREKVPKKEREKESGLAEGEERRQSRCQR